MTRDAEWLRKTLDAVDRVFFLGAVSRDGVRIKWMRWRKTKTEFVYGRYDQDRKTIEINPVLKHAWVPEEVAVDVVHHEALHVVAGPDHGPVFQWSEMAYPYRRRADAWCDENINNLLNAEPPKETT
jgi:predicted metal-dependent hydrolase